MLLACVSEVAVMGLMIRWDSRALSCTKWAPRQQAERTHQVTLYLQRNNTATASHTNLFNSLIIPENDENCNFKPCTVMLFLLEPILQTDLQMAITDVVIANDAF